LKALGAFKCGGFPGTVGAQEGGDLAALGDEGDPAHHPEHFSVQACKRAYILN
jgi:hypothetical protein